jgi:sulfite exporter TauE/SafE
MDLTLALTAFLMGLAGAPHCAVMCGPSCAAVLGSGGARSGTAGAVAVSTVTFHAFRVVSYALAGAVAATGVGLLAWAGQAAPWVRPLWTMLHVAALALGLWLAVTGQQPAFMTKVNKTRTAPAAPERVLLVSGASLALPLRRTAAAGPLAAASAGSLWVIWPCGLLQSALVVSGLANSALAGAGVMAAFALASSLGLLWLPQLLRWWARRQGKAASRARLERAMVRLAGGLLALGSVWALGQDVWGKVWAYCFG